MEEVAKADCVSARRVGLGGAGVGTLLARGPAPRPGPELDPAPSPRRRSGCSGARARQAAGERLAGAWARVRPCAAPCAAPARHLSVRRSARRLWALGLLLLALGFLALPLVLPVAVKPAALRRALPRLRSHAALRRLRYALSPLLELRARGPLPT